MLVRVLKASQTLGATKICVVYGHGGDVVRTAVQSAMPQLDVAWAKQEPQLGTGHAVLQALPHLDPTFPTLVLYGDVPLVSVTTLSRLRDIAAQGLGLLTVEMVDPTGYGRIVRVEDKPVGIVEERDADEATRRIREVNTGMLVAPTEALIRWLPTLGNTNTQGEYYLTDIVTLAVKEGMSIATTQPEHLFEVLGVNSKVQLAELERMFQKNQAVLLMEQGVTLLDPDRLDVRGKLDCGRDVVIDINCVFEGHVNLGDGVEIGANCVLKNAKVAAGARIAAFSHIDDAEIGPRCVVGPYARLRPGTQLGEGVHIGNFVEVKNSSIADHSKANHLSYIGDATVGKNVNIGAGTITCNYDGANKHRTVIEDDVFIGSDTQLVAPVTVGRGATVGAGTTLTTNAPPDQLTVSRAKQMSVPSWKRPTKNK